MYCRDIVGRILYATSPTELAERIRTARDGDTVVVESAAAAELGRRARDRMRPGLVVHFELRASEDRTKIAGAECSECGGDRAGVPVDEGDNVHWDDLITWGAYARRGADELAERQQDDE